MEPRPPDQLTNIAPFSGRLFSTISKDYVALFPELDVRPGDSSLSDALARPIFGELWPNFSSFDDTTPEQILAISPYNSSWIIRDEDFEDTGLQVTEDGISSLSVSAGYAVVAGIFINYTDDTVIDLTDSTNFVGDSTQGGEHYVCIVPSDAEGDISLDLIGASTTAFVLITKTLYDTLEEMPFILPCFLRLASVTLDTGGQILSLDFENEDWNRELLAYPPGPPLNPSLNGGVVESGDNWLEDWT